MKHEIKFTEKQIKDAIKNSADQTMGGAAIILGVDWRTFKRESEKVGLYKPRHGNRNKFLLKDILDGKHPQYPTSHLSKRLVKEGIKEYKCECCGITDWNGLRIGLELNHKDGNKGNHRLNNLELICPNCHSQTNTYRSKKLLLK